MAGHLERQLRQIIEERSQATGLDSLIQGYRLCARSEGKSPNTITLTTAALSFLISGSHLLSSEVLNRLISLIFSTWLGA